MEHAGIDLGKRESQIAIITEAGELIEKRMRTERERLRQFLSDRPKATPALAGTWETGERSHHVVETEHDTHSPCETEGEADEPQEALSGDDGHAPQCDSDGKKRHGDGEDEVGVSGRSHEGLLIRNRLRQS